MRNNQKGFLHLVVLMIITLAMVGMVVALNRLNFDIREKAASGEPPSFGTPKKTPVPTPKATPYPRATSCSDVQVIGAVQGSSINGKKTYSVKSGVTLTLIAITTPSNGLVNWKVTSCSQKLPCPGTFSPNNAPVVGYKPPINTSGSDQSIEIRGDISESPDSWKYCPPFALIIKSR